LEKIPHFSGVLGWMGRVGDDRENCKIPVTGIYNGDFTKEKGLPGQVG